MPEYIYQPAERRPAFPGILTERRLPPHVVAARRPMPIVRNVRDRERDAYGWEEAVRCEQYKQKVRAQKLVHKKGGDDALDELLRQQKNPVVDRLFHNEVPVHRRPVQPEPNPLSVFADWQQQQVAVDPAARRAAARRPNLFGRKATAFEQQFTRADATRVDATKAGKNVVTKRQHGW